MTTALLGILAAPTGVGGGLPPAGDALRPLRDGTLTPLRRGALAPGEVRAPFALTLDGEPVALRMASFSVLPGGAVEIGVVEVAGATLTYQDGRARAVEPGRWRWNAPEVPGAYALRVEADGKMMDLTALVLHPAEWIRNGVLGRYRIGEYRRQPLRGDPAYLPPEGFFEVSAADRDLLVSPRLTVGQFLCKQPGEPRYLALSARLLEKLETVLDHMEARGLDPASLVVMSGFRTPAYNRAIGNTTSYSRHLWGDAIYVDADGDGEMDDLDGDGRVGVGDARFLARLVEEMMDGPGGAHLHPGGLAVYRRNAVRGPFLHLDARGTRARW